jgi:hypothetical protein
MRFSSTAMMANAAENISPKVLSHYRRIALSVLVTCKDIFILREHRTKSGEYGGYLFEGISRCGYFVVQHCAQIIQRLS